MKTGSEILAAYRDQPYGVIGGFITLEEMIDKALDEAKDAEVLESNSTPLLCVDDRLDQAEREILQVCKKYDIDLAPKYDDGVAVVMVYSEKNPDKSTTIHEREIDT